MKKILLLVSCLTLPHSLHTKTFLVFGGKTGWIGSQLVKLLRNQGYTAVPATSRLQNYQEVEQEIVQTQPDCIINAAGVTGRPNIDWCEDHKQETIRSNLVGALILFDVAYAHDIHVIHFGTGCIYEYDNEHPMYSNKGFTEEDTPNFEGSFYSFTKCMLDKLTKSYPNVLNLRLRMPISSDLHPRSFVTKIIKYAKVVNIPNSMSILDDLLLLVPLMAERKLTGTYNFVNSGVLSHNEILDLYTQYIDPTFTYHNFSLEEQAKILKAGRSNNQLDTTKLVKEFPNIPHIQESIHAVFKKMKTTLAS